MGNHGVGHGTWSPTALTLRWRTPDMTSEATSDETRAACHEVDPGRSTHSRVWSHTVSVLTYLITTQRERRRHIGVHRQRRERYGLSTSGEIFSLATVTSKRHECWHRRST